MHFSLTKDSDGLGEKLQWFQELVGLLNWRPKVFSWEGVLQSELLEIYCLLFG